MFNGKGELIGLAFDGNWDSLSSDINFDRNAYDKLMSDIVNPVFYKFFVKADAFTANDKCIGCGKCAKMCPLNNIELKNSKPVWGKNCTHCMACICLCPTEAIEYGKKSVGKPRYHLD